MVRRWPIPRLGPGRTTAGRGAPTGDDERFRRAVLPHLDAAYGYARYLARDASAAEDIVQEAFLRAFRAMGTCRGNEKAWLLAIVRNCYHDWTRERGGETLMGLRVDLGNDERYEDRHAMQAIEQRVAAGQVRALIESLPEPFREALVLRELHELSYRDIAETTGAPIGTVMSRLARAREMLALLLRGGQPDDDTALAREASRP